MEQRLQRTALVTGGRRGIGAAIVAELSARNVNVLAPTRSELDLADARAIEQFIERSKAKDLQIDILVNNAGINIINPVEEISQETWLTTLQVNLNALFGLPRHLRRRCETADGDGSSTSVRCLAL